MRKKLSFRSRELLTINSPHLESKRFTLTFYHCKAILFANNPS